MNKKILLLRICYWIGILLDGYAAVQLTLIRFVRLPVIGEMIRAKPELLEGASAAGQAAALMWGWTFLLFWADRKPAERRGVLLLTIFPVLLLLVVNTADFLSVFSISPYRIIILVIQIALVILFSTGCFLTRSAKNN